MSLLGFLDLETRRYFRNTHNFITPFVFTTLIVIITVVVHPRTLEFSYGLLWICVVLAFLLNTEQLFRADYRHGLLEQYFFSAIPPYFIVLTKVAVFFLFNTLGFLMINLPMIWFLTNLDTAQLGMFLLCLLVAAPSLGMLVALGASYALASSGGFIPALISLPFYVPLIILSMLALVSPNPLYFVSFLAAATLLYIALLPWAIQFILKNLTAA